MFIHQEGGLVSIMTEPPPLPYIHPFYLVSLPVCPSFYSHYPPLLPDPPNYAWCRSVAYDVPLPLLPRGQLPPHRRRHHHHNATPPPVLLKNCQSSRCYLTSRRYISLWDGDAVCFGQTRKCVEKTAWKCAKKTCWKFARQTIWKSAKRAGRVKSFGPNFANWLAPLKFAAGWPGGAVAVLQLLKDRKNSWKKCSVAVLSLSLMW